MQQQQGETSETSFYLQTKYRQLQEQYTQLQQHYALTVQALYAHLRHQYMLIACAWCQQCLRLQRKESSVPGEISHGICRPCATRLLTQHAP